MQAYTTWLPLPLHAAVIFLFALSLVACAGSDGDSGSGSGDPTPTTVVAPRDAASPVAPPGTPLAPPPGGGAPGSITVSWLAPQANTDGSALTNLRGYRIYYGHSVNKLDKVVVIDTVGLTRYVIDNVPPATWYVAMTSVNSQGVESARSAVASKVIRG